MPRPNPSPNLIRAKSFEEESASRKLLLFFKTWGRFIILTSQLLVILSFFWRFILDEELAALNRQLLRQVEIVKSYAATEKTITTAGARLAILKQVNDTSFDPAKILNNLSLNLPQSVSLTQVTISRQSVQMEARTKSIGDFAKLLNNLKESPMYKEIILKTTWYRVATDDFVVSLELPL